jgi:hypothetical protein
MFEASFLIALVLLEVSFLAPFRTDNAILQRTMFVVKPFLTDEPQKAVFTPATRV